MTRRASRSEQGCRPPIDGAASALARGAPEDRVDDLGSILFVSAVRVVVFALIFMVGKLLWERFMK